MISGLRALITFATIAGLRKSSAILVQPGLLIVS